MPDDLGGQNPNDPVNANSGANTDPLNMGKSTSPLEQAGEGQPQTQLSELPPAPASPATNPTPPLTSDQPVSAPPEEAPTAETPDTDAFLESILSDKQTGGATPIQPTETAPATEQPATPLPAAEPPEPLTPSAPEPPIDATPSMDSMGAATPPTTPPSTGQLQPQPENPIGTMKTPPPKQGGGTTRILALTGAAAVVIIGGYIAFTRFFSAPKSTTDEVQTAVTNGLTSAVVPTSSVIAAQTPAVALTNDQQRKKDLADLQTALKNYRSGSTTYPVAEKLVFLSNPDNPLKILVTMNLIAKLPQDPDSTKQYAYKSDGTTYKLTAMLDNASDPEATVEGGNTLYVVTQDTVTSTASTSTGTLPTTSQSVISSSDSNYPVTDLNAAANQ